MRDAPLCDHCGVNPVRWDDTHGKARAGWRRFCSRVCAGKCSAKSERLAAYNKQRSAQFHVSLITDVVGSRWRSGDPVTLEQLVRLVRAARSAGYEAAHHIEWRKRRRAA